MQKAKYDDANSEAFFQEERRFLNGRCDLPALLFEEGWTQVPSRFKDTQQFHRKGRIVEVQFHAGLHEYHWKEEVRGHEISGLAIDILAHRGQNDAKQRFIDALDVARRHVLLTHPKATETFYGKHPIGRNILQELQLTDYRRLERKFLRQELSIYKVAHELGYVASEAKRSERTYFRKGDSALSIERKKSGEYLWFDHDTREGGFVEHLVQRDARNNSSSQALLVEFASRLIAKDKLETFLTQSARMPLETLSLRALLERRKDFALKITIVDLQQQYTDLPVFQDWSADHVLRESLLRHYRVPELHPGFGVLSASVGQAEAKALVRIALLREASAKIPPEYVSAACETEVIKPAIRSFLAVLAGIQAGGEVTLHAIRKIVMGNVAEQEMMRPILVNSPAKEKGMSL